MKEIADMEIRELETELRMRRLQCASSLANNLCPDHRDKQKRKPCLACEIERLEFELDQAEVAQGRAEARAKAGEKLAEACAAARSAIIFGGERGVDWDAITDELNGALKAWSAAKAKPNSP